MLQLVGCPKAEIEGLRNQNDPLHPPKATRANQRFHGRAEAQYSSVCFHLCFRRWFIFAEIHYWNGIVIFVSRGLEQMEPGALKQHMLILMPQSHLASSHSEMMRCTTRMFIWPWVKIQIVPPSEHPNPTKSTKWVVNSPNPKMGSDWF